MRGDEPSGARGQVPSSSPPPAPLPPALRGSRDHSRRAPAPGPAQARARLRRAGLQPTQAPPRFPAGPQRSPRAPPPPLASRAGLARAAPIPPAWGATCWDPQVQRVTERWVRAPGAGQIRPLVLLETLSVRRTGPRRSHTWAARPRYFRAPPSGSLETFAPGSPPRANPKEKASSHFLVG